MQRKSVSQGKLHHISDFEWRVFSPPAGLISPLLPTPPTKAPLSHRGGSGNGRTGGRSPVPRSPPTPLRFIMSTALGFRCFLKGEHVRAEAPRCGNTLRQAPPWEGRASSQPVVQKGVSRSTPRGLPLSSATSRPPAVPLPGKGTEECYQSGSLHEETKHHHPKLNT